MADVRNDGPLSGDDADRDHWLVRRRTVRGLWICLLVVLASILLAQAIVPIKSYSDFDDWLGFGAAFGFVACVVLVLVAKAIGALLKRNDDYYDV